MTWMFIISTTVWVNGWDTSSVASRTRSELTSSQCNWKRNRKGKGTDETPHCKCKSQETKISKAPVFLVTDDSQYACYKLFNDLSILRRSIGCVGNNEK